MPYSASDHPLHSSLSVQLQIYNELDCFVERRVHEAGKDLTMVSAGSSEAMLKCEASGLMTRKFRIKTAVASQGRAGQQR